MHVPKQYEDAAELADASGRICCAAADLPSDSRAGFHFARVGRQSSSQRLPALITPDRLREVRSARVEKKKRTVMKIFPDMAGSTDRERGLRPQDDGGQTADAVSTSRADF